MLIFWSEDENENREFSNVKASDDTYVTERLGMEN